MGYVEPPEIRGGTGGTAVGGQRRKAGWWQVSSEEGRPTNGKAEEASLRKVGSSRETIGQECSLETQGWQLSHRDPGKGGAKPKMDKGVNTSPGTGGKDSGGH